MDLKNVILLFSISGSPRVYLKNEILHFLAARTPLLLPAYIFIKKNVTYIFGGVEIADMFKLKM